MAKRKKLPVGYLDGKPVYDAEPGDTLPMPTEADIEKYGLQGALERVFGCKVTIDLTRDEPPGFVHRFPVERTTGPKGRKTRGGK
jgi:hypothetical protein